MLSANLQIDFEASFLILSLSQQGKIGASSMQLSLDPPISALADATFKLLKMNHWFDAIIVVDDTSSSDLFSYR